MTLHPDTIAAVATAPGPGALAVVRISGPRAFAVLSRIAPGLPAGAAPRFVQLTEIVDPGSGEVVDQALVVGFQGPASYTGEDVVEITGHGGVLAPALVLESVLKAGAREAEPGEFTRRAYLNGKMDLVQAEAVLDLVEGRSRALHRAAVHQLERGLSQRIARLRERVVSLEAYLAHHLDFPEEDDPPTPVEAIAGAAEGLGAELAALAATAPEGVLLRQGALTVLAGAPNAGKSSLFNALSGEERALVTEIPGTTRDAIEAEVSLGGYPFRLVDTAGLRHTEEVVERLGIEVAERYLRSADLVLFCVEGGRALTGSEAAFLRDLDGTPVVLVRTKSDAGGGDEGEAFGGLPDAVRETVCVSVRTGEGMRRLRELLPELVFHGLVASSATVPVLTRERQARAVREAEAEVMAFGAALREGVPPEVASAHLKDALSALESVVGVVTGEDVLDHLFRSFCIGK
ncbi:MAG TPA: tRNA uridine-5-carboxymethylaminomethyl(34) synthesis GTPase MnmE [Longimicrobiales bacterium]|nr:tRNA uridine-5-carboxymethylaminomethyl(34) synthesis GTPase MnmE [Longimicrobiales bacterium]